MFYELIHQLVARVPGLGADAAAELHREIDQHKAEHEALVSGGQVPAPSPAEAAPAPADPVQEGTPA